MQFSAPARLFALIGAAAAAVGYVIVQVQRRRYARRFASPALYGSVAPVRPGAIRHLTAAALVAGLAVGSMAFAAPTMRRRVPRGTATIVLALDVSDSMAATDVRPSRLAAAKTAAQQFVRNLPDRFRIGLVTFNARTVVLATPTTDHASVEQLLAHLDMAPGTAIGEAIFTSLPLLPAVSPTGSGPRAARIVVLSDGATNVGRPGSLAAAAAVKARIPVSTIAYGTDNATVRSQGQTVSVPVNRSELRQIASATGGTFSEAATGVQLSAIYDRIGSEIQYVTQRRDVTAWFIAGALGLLVLAAVGSLASSNRLAGL